MADTWQEIVELAETPASTDDVLVRDISDTTDDGEGTVKRNSRTNFLGSVLTALTGVFTPASSAGPASLDLHEDTDNGAHRVRLTAPSALGGDRTATLPDADGTLALTSNIPVQGVQVGPVDANITYSRATHGDMVTFFYGASVPLTAMRTLTFPYTEGVTGGMVIVRVREDALWPVLVRLEDPDVPGTYEEIEVDNATRILRKSVTGSWWTDMGQFIHNGNMVSTRGDAIFVIETIQNDTPRLYMARADGTHVWHALRIDASGNLIFRYDTTNSDRMSISPAGVVNIGGTVLTPASTSGAASIALPEDADNGVNTVALQAPAAVASNRTATLQDASGTVAYLGDITFETLSGAGDVGSGASQVAAGNHVHAAGDVTSGTFADARIAQSNVTQHQAALSLTEGQIQLGATDVLVGRQTAGAGAAEEIICTAAGRALIDDADATAQRVTLGLVIGTDVQAFNSDLTALIAAFTPASGTGPTTMAFAEDTDNGVNTVTLSAPSSIGGNATLTMQATSGQLYSSNGTDVAVADGGTGVSTLTSGNVLVGAGTSAVTTTKAAPTGDFVGTTDSQTLSGKTLSNVVLTGTVTVPDGALAIADTSGLQAALDGKQPLDSDLTTLATAFTSAGGSAASLKLAEPTGAGSTGVLLTGPTTSASDKAVTFQDVAGTVYVSGGQNVALADGGTGADDAPGARSALGLVIGTDVAPINNASFTGTFTVPNASISYAEIQDVSATDRLLGRSSASAGPIEEITCTLAGRALLDDADATSQRATLGLVIGTDVAPINNATFTGTFTAPNDSISYAEIQNVSAASRLLGRGDSGAGDPQEISLGSGLSMTGTTLSVSAGGGNVSNAGTPADNQLAIWTGATTIEGDSDLTWDDAIFTIRNVVVTPASAAGAASLFLPEDTDNGVLGVSIAAPAQVVTASKVATLQDVTGLLYVTGGQDVSVADGGTGVSTLTSGGVVVGAGTSAVTSNKLAPTGDFVGTTDTQTLSGKTVNNIVLTGTVTVPDGALAIADTSGLQTALDAKAPLASPTFTGTVALPNDQISYAEMQNVAALSVIGNGTNAVADPADITAVAASGAVLRESGSTLGFGTIATAGVADNAISNAKLRDSTALTVIGRSANSTGDPADIAATAASGAVLRESGSTLGFGTIATAGIADDAVTDAKLRNSAALSVVGRSANSTGDPADIAAGADGDVLRRSGTTLGFGAIAQASVTNLTSDLAAKLALAGGTMTGQISLGSGGSINDAGPISASGSLTRATHGGRVVVTSGDVTVPNASGDVGMGGVIVLGGAHRVIFNSQQTAPLAAGDIFTYYVQTTTTLVRRLSPVSQLVAMS